MDEGDAPRTRAGAAYHCAATTHHQTWRGGGSSGSRGETQRRGVRGSAGEETLAPRRRQKKASMVRHNFQECARAPLGPQPNGLREPPGSTNAIKPMTGRQAYECFKHRAGLPRGPSKQTWPAASPGPVPGGRTGKQTCSSAMTYESEGGIQSLLLFVCCCRAR